MVLLQVKLILWFIPSEKGGYASCRQERLSAENKKNRKKFNSSYFCYYLLCKLVNIHHCSSGLICVAIGVAHATECLNGVIYFHHFH